VKLIVGVKGIERQENAQWPRTAAAEQPKLTTTTAATERPLVGVRQSEQYARQTKVILIVTKSF
jgi:hypothetical protein